MVLFLVALTVSTAVGIRNEIKQGRYIGAEDKNTISVSGEGTVYADPDLALTNFSVVTEKETVDRALEENKKKMNKVIERIKQQGIEGKDLKTTTFDIQPRYEWHEKTQEDRTKGERVLVGYEVTQDLQVKVRELGKVGEIIQEATDAGANRVGNLRFTIEDEEQIKKEARKEAINQAKSKARETASQLGVDLVRIVNFSENFYIPRSSSEALMEKQAGGAAPEIEPGQNKVEVNVNITYEID